MTTNPSATETPTQHTEPTVMTCQDAADALGLSLSALAEACMARRLPFVPMPGRDTADAQTTFSIHLHGIPAEVVRGLAR